MNGVISLKAKVIVPPEKRPFIEKLRLDGDFGIADARFTSVNTQTRVDQLSERARGEKEVTVNVIAIPWPTTEGSGAWPVIVVVVPAAFTV